MITFSVPLLPIPFKRTESNEKRRYNLRSYTEFKDALGYFAAVAMRGREPFKGAIKFSADFFKPKPRKSKFLRGGINFAINPDFGDVDNLVKTVMDSLNGICYIDDRQVIEIYARKFFGKPHIEISLEEIK